MVFFLCEGLIVSQMKQLYTSNITRGLESDGPQGKIGAETVKYLVKKANGCKKLPPTEKKKCLL